MGIEFKEAYRAVPHLRNPPTSGDAVRPLRDNRHGACQKHGGAKWAGSPHGRMECAFCAVHGGNATQCRVTGPSCSGHGPTLFVDTDGWAKGGPDADAALFPVGASVTCTQPAFAGVVTRFNVRTGEHTLKLADGTERSAFLAYHSRACTVIYPPGVPKPSHELPCKPKPPPKAAGAPQVPAPAPLVAPAPPGPAPAAKKAAGKPTPKPAAKVPKPAKHAPPPAPKAPPPAPSGTRGGKRAAKAPVAVAPPPAAAPKAAATLPKSAAGGKTKTKDKAAAAPAPASAPSAAQKRKHAAPPPPPPAAKRRTRK